jgi:hypothetical protein
MLEDILKESWVYQEIGQAYEKSFKQGFDQGRAEERQKTIEVLHLILECFVETHFPEITKLATQHIDTIDDPETLQTVFYKLLAARNLEQAKGIFSEVDTV